MDIQIKIDNTKLSEQDHSRVLLLLPPEGAATAEDLAMIQALYSRDPRPIDDAVKLARTSNSGEFMKKFYVGYGHQSIADCGYITLAVENVSMAVAKLIQHDQLYNGQECSTRYLDFSTQGMVHTSEDGPIAKRLREIYNENLDKFHNYAAETHGLDMADGVENKTAKAAAFDILRGLLPVGTLTNLSWTTSIRNFYQHLARLKRVNAFLRDDLPFHKGSVSFMEIIGLHEVIEKMENLVGQAFPNSQAKYDDDKRLLVDSGFDTTDSIEFNGRAKRSNRGATLHDIHPWSVVNASGMLDFASWRDLARHRSIKQTFPFHFSQDIHPFYAQHIGSVDMDILEEVEQLTSEAIDPHAMPMGCLVPYNLQGTLNDWSYIINLRTGHTVHPTLREKMLDLAKFLNIPIPHHRSSYEWTVSKKRASQDIKKV